MKAVVFAEQGRVAVEDVPRPSVVEPDDIVVKVSLTSICASDLHLLDGKTPGMRTGGVIGHEYVGTVADIGPAVTDLHEGTRVLGSFLIACGTCTPCTSGRFNHCAERRALGLGTLTGDLDGAQAEYVRVPHASMNVKPLLGAYAGLDDEAALFGGDILATGFYAAAIADPAPDASVAILGAGPIGLLTAAAMPAAARVLLLDTDPKRVEYASGLGFEARSVTDDADTVVQRELGAPADIAIDAVGSIPAFKAALRCARDGGRLVVVGVYGAERYELPMGVVWVRGLEIRFAGMANVHAHWDDALMKVAKGVVDPTRLITHRLALDEAEEGYSVFAEREAVKVVLRV